MAAAVFFAVVGSFVTNAVWLIGTVGPKAERDAVLVCRRGGVFGDWGVCLIRGTMTAFFRVYLSITILMWALVLWNGLVFILTGVNSLASTTGDRWACLFVLTLVSTVATLIAWLCQE